VDEAPRTNRTGLAAGFIGAVLLLATLAVVLDLGPFADDDLSAAEFLAQGDEICSQAHDDFLEIQNSAPRTPEDAEAQVEALIKVAEEERNAILDLSAPASLEDGVTEYVKEREKGIATLEDGLAAARDDDAGAYEAAQAELAAQQDDRQKAAQRLGFNECSEPLVDDDELERQAEPPTGG